MYALQQPRTHTHTAEYGHAHNPIDRENMWKTTEWYVMFSYWPWAVGSQGGRARMKGVFFQWPLRAVTAQPRAVGSQDRALR